MLYGLRQRLQFFKDAFARRMVAVAGSIIFLLTLAVTVRDGMLPPEYQQWRVLEYLPHWSWRTWTIIILTFLLIVMTEGSFRTHQKRIREGQKRYKSRVRELRAEHQQQFLTTGVTELVNSTRVGKQINDEQANDKAVRLRIRKELMPLLQEGRRLARETNDEPPRVNDLEEMQKEDRYWNERRAWMRETINFLRINLGEHYFDRFHSQNKNNGKISRSDIHDQVFQLELIARELLE